MSDSIVDALKGDEINARVTCGYRWLVWADDQWVVYERKPHQKRTRTIIETTNEVEAVKHLTGQGEP